MRLALAVLAIAVVAAAAIALNLVLLGNAAGAGDRVGNLRPLVRMPATVQAPPGVVRPMTTTEHETERKNDD